MQTTQNTDASAVRDLSTNAGADGVKQTAFLKDLAVDSVGEVEVFEDKDFQGNSWRTSLSYIYVGDDWNDKISSMIVYSGTWAFFEHRDYGGARKDLPPGHYPWVGDVGIANDSISSFGHVQGT